MIEVRLALALALPIVAGWLALCLLVPLSRHGTLSTLERLSVGYGVGTGMLTTIMLCLTFIGLPLTLPVILMAMLCLTGVMVLAATHWKLTVWPAITPRQWATSVRTEMHQLEPSARTVFEGLLALGLLYRLAMAWAEVFLRPVFAWDSFTYWSLYAKVLFLEKRMPTASDLITAAGPISSHPLHVPLLQDWFSLALGQWDDVLVSTPFAAYHTALILVIYFGLRRGRSRMVALLFTFLAASLPLLAAHAGVAQGDLPVAFYATAAAVYLSGWVTLRGTGLLALSLILGALAVWTKAVGMLVLGIIVVLLVLWLFRAGRVHAWRQASRYLVLAVTVLAAALIVLRLASFPIPLSLDQRLSFQSDVIEPYLRSLFLGGSWGITWSMFVVVTVLCWRRPWSSRDLYPFLFTWLGLLSFLGIYLLLPAYHDNVLNGTVLDRNTLTFAPMAVYTVGLLTAARFRRSPRRAGSRPSRAGHATRESVAVMARSGGNFHGVQEQEKDR